MKRCPKCGQSYTDKDLNFCYNDGELLSQMVEDAPRDAGYGRPSKLYADDPPPTEFMGASRITKETKWPPQAAPVAWDQAQTGPPAAPQFGGFPTQVAQNQTLAIVSLGLGVGAMTIGWCCSSGLLLSPAALITGFIALSQIKRDPTRNGGRGFAIAGIATGSVFLALYLLFILIYGLALIGGGLAGG